MRDPDSHFSIRSEEIARGMERGNIDPIVSRVRERVSRDEQTASDVENLSEKNGNCNSDCEQK